MMVEGESAQHEPAVEVARSGESRVLDGGGNLQLGELPGDRLVDEAVEQRDEGGRRQDLICAVPVRVLP